MDPTVTSQSDTLDQELFGDFQNSSEEERSEPTPVKKEIVRNAKKTLKTEIYSQRLGQFIPAGSCIRCGELGHSSKSPVCKLMLPKGEKQKSWHFGGQTTPQQRATRFVDFILSKFDHEALKVGGVLDIAGGMGKLALEFQLRRGVPCTIVDPRREMCLSEKQKNFLKFQEEHPQDFLTVTQLPQQKQILFEDDYLDDPSNASHFETVQMIVGLHPDQATERIVQFGIKYKKNFAVVPCCVFYRQFPNRFLSDGRPVRHYEEFCDYLASLHPEIQRDVLPMPGRNVVLWAKFQ